MDLFWGLAVSASLFERRQIEEKHMQHGISKRLVDIHTLIIDSTKFCAQFQRGEWVFSRNCECPVALSRGRAGLPVLPIGAFTRI
jgi:hypothetical protein